MLPSPLWYANRLPASKPTHQAHPACSTIELPRRAEARNGFPEREPSMEAENTWIVAWIILHLIALAAAYGTRVAAGSCLEGFTQVIFFAAMLMMGFAIWACQQVHPGAWGLSAVTLI